MARGAHSFTNPATLEEFDDESLHRILLPHSDFCAHSGLPLPATLGEPIDREALARILQSGESLPRQMLDAFLTIGDVGLPKRLAELITLAHKLGIPGDDVIGDAITPVMVAARIWCEDASALKRLSEQTLIEVGHTYRTWRCDANEPPVYPGLDEAGLRAWEDMLTTEFANKGLGDGVRVFINEVDDYVFFLIRHGCSPKREITHVSGGDRSNMIFRPSRTDILRYDTLTGDLAIYQRESRKWQTELYLTSCALYAFNHPHLFASNDSYDLTPVRDLGPLVLNHEGIDGITSIKLVMVKVATGNSYRYSVRHEATDLFAAWAAEDTDWQDLPPMVEATFEVAFGSAKPRKVKVRPPNVVRCAKHGDEVMVQKWLLRHGIRKVLVAAHDQPEF
jgi:hypothetical protein